MTEEVRYIVGRRRQVIELHKESHGWWCDCEGTIYAFVEQGNSRDLKARCGVWPFALPLWGVFIELNYLCSRHDFTYGSPVYQAYNNREVADVYLNKLLECDQKKWYSRLGDTFFNLTRTWGYKFWDNKKTND